MGSLPNELEGFLERPLGTHEHPERLCIKNPGSLRVESDSSDAVSGSFGVIRVIVFSLWPWRNDGWMTESRAASPARSLYQDSEDSSLHSESE
jgi:hypothetical protein